MDFPWQNVEEEWSKKLVAAVNDGAAETVHMLLKVRRDAIRGSKDAESEETFGDQGLLDALFAAIKENRSEIAKQLIKTRGIKLTRQDDRKSTALHEAVAMGRTDVVRELLDHAKVVRYIDLGNDLGRAALHEAAGRGNDELVQLLLASGADIDVLDDQDMTPLHLVICLRKDSTGGEEDEQPINNARVLLRMAKRLLSRYGARVNTKDQFSKKPL